VIFVSHDNLILQIVVAQIIDEGYCVLSFKRFDNGAIAKRRVSSDEKVPDKWSKYTRYNYEVFGLAVS
jgi:hypothetical protein